MSDKILAMFNTISSADYLISNPYSSSCNRVFKSLFKNEKEGKFHEERIIHRHITYLDNFRRHLILDVYPEKVQEINKKIIDVIEKYICLLNNNVFGDMSKSLIIELTYCIKYIKGKEYNDTTTEISRDAYKILMEKKENE